MEHPAPEVRHLLDEVGQGFAAELHGETDPAIALVRDATRRVMTAAFIARGGTLPEVAAIENHEVPVPDGAVAARVYRPSEHPGLPVILRIHGGGWTLGSTRWLPFEALSRGLAVDTNCVVVVDYRLAPEHPPAPHTRLWRVLSAIAAAL